MEETVVDERRRQGAPDLSLEQVVDRQLAERVTAPDAEDELAQAWARTPAPLWSRTISAEDDDPERAEGHRRGEFPEIVDQPSKHSFVVSAGDGRVGQVEWTRSVGRRVTSAQRRAEPLALPGEFALVEDRRAAVGRRRGVERDPGLAAGVLGRHLEPMRDQQRRKTRTPSTHRPGLR